MGLYHFLLEGVSFDGPCIYSGIYTLLSLRLPLVVRFDRIWCEGNVGGVKSGLTGGSGSIDDSNEFIGEVLMVSISSSSIGFLDSDWWIAVI